MHKSITKIIRQNLFLLFLSFYCFGFSQKSQSFDLVSGIDFSYRILLNNGAFPNTIENLNERENGIINFRFGINYNYQLSKRLFFKTGLRVSHFGEHQKYTLEEAGLIFIDQIDPESGPIAESSEIEPNSDGIFEFDIKNRHKFLEIPLVIRHEFEREKLFPFYELGLSPNLYMLSNQKGSINEYEFDSKNRITEKNFRKINFEFLVSIGLQYLLQENTSIFIQSNYRVYILKKYIKSTIKEYPYNIGIELGVRKFLNTKKSDS